MTKYNLKYLYRAIYYDGSKYDQNLEDRSIKNESKNCYYDLILDKIHYFTLSNGLDSYTLDLSDGGFSVNGSDKFYLSNKGLSNFKLIHYRKLMMTIKDDKRQYNTAFILGYEAKDNKDNVTNSIIIE